MQIAALIAFLICAFTANLTFAAPKPPDCQGYLLGFSKDVDEKIYRNTVHARFAVGFDDEDEIAAYAGISHSMMKELLEQGQIDLSEEESPIEINPTDQHPAGARMISGFPIDDDDVWDRETVTSMSAMGAQIHSAFDQVISRVDRKSHRLDEDGFAAVMSIIDSLDFSLGKNDEDVFSPNFEMISKAILDADIPSSYDDSDEPSEPMARKAFQQLIIDEKLLIFAGYIGLPATSRDLTNPHWQKQLELLFSNLPQSAGYILGLIPEVLDGLENPHEAMTHTIRLQDIAGIEPLGNDEFTFLSTLVDKPADQ